MRRFLFCSSILCLIAHVGCRADEQNPDDSFDLTDGSDMRGDMITVLPDMRPDVEDMPRVDMDPPPPDMSLDMTLEDMVVDMPDSSGDMGVDMTVEPPLRQVVERGLMGDMPMQNYFKDPVFDSLNSEYTWLVTPAQQGQGFSLLPAYRHVSSGAPMRASSLKVPKDTTRNVIVYGEVNLHVNVPTLVSIWVGRKGITLGAAGSPPSVSVYAMNVADFQDYSGVDLRLVPGTSVIDDGIRWVKYEAQVSGMAGYGYLTVQDISTDDLYLHAPMAVALPSNPSGALRPPVPPSLVSAEESAALKRVVGFVLEKRSTPPAARETGPTPYPF